MRKYKKYTREEYSKKMMICWRIHLIMLCRKESRSSSARNRTRRTGLCLMLEDAMNETIRRRAE